MWSISEDKAEFERSKRLLGGSLKSALDDQKISAAIREHSVAAVGDEARLIVLHDPCDIRKEHAQVLEKPGKVRDLEGNLINGCSIFNTVMVDVSGKKLYSVDWFLILRRLSHLAALKCQQNLESCHACKLQNIG